jgi:hypothetical protein
VISGRIAGQPTDHKPWLLAKDLDDTEYKRALLLLLPLSELMVSSTVWLHPHEEYASPLEKGLTAHIGLRAYGHCESMRYIALGVAGPKYWVYHLTVCGEGVFWKLGMPHSRPWGIRVSEGR